MENSKFIVRKKVEFLAGALAIATIFFLPISTALTNIAFILALVFYYLAGNLRDKFNLIRYNPVALAMLGFYALFILGCSFTVAPEHDVLQVMLKYDRFLFAVLLLSLFAEEKWRRYALAAFLLSISIVLILSYIKFFAHLRWDLNRGHAELFKNHIDFNFMLGIAAYLVMQKIVIEKNLLPKLAWIVFAMLLSYNIVFMSVGRSGYVVFAALVFIFFVQMFKSKGVVIALVILPLLFFTAYKYSPLFFDYINAIPYEIKSYANNKQNTSLGERFNFTKNSLKLMSQRPFLGHGTGSFKNEYANIKPTPVPLTNNPHNEYMHIGVQFGLLGVAVLLFMFGIQLWASKFLPRDMRLLAQAVVLSIAIGCMANSWLMDNVEGNLYVYFMALTFGAYKRQRLS